MTLKSKILIFFFIGSFWLNEVDLFAQTKEANIINQLGNLYRFNQLDSVVSLSDKTIQNLNQQISKDSLLYAKLYLYRFMALHETNKSLKNISSIAKAIDYCPNSYTGDSLKATLYNRKAYLENELSSGLKSYKSILQSLKLLESLPNPNPGFLMGAYLLLSNKNAYYGNFDNARHYMRLAEDIYDKKKTEIDGNTLELNGNHHRLGVIAKYRKIYMLWKLSENSKDSLMLVNTMNDLEMMHNKPDFHQEERIYYSTALNHIGDWFTSHKPDSLTTKIDIQLGLNYLFKALNFTENKGYPGTPWAIKYNIAKGFAKGNLLEKADSTMAVLFNGISKTDGRLPFFLAQKALIKAKKNQKDSALFYFSNAIQKIHNADEILAKDYSNFKPSKSYNHTKLLLRINEELQTYYDADSIVLKKINTLYYLALQQFENSYLETSFNDKQNQELRQIIQGILKTKKTGYQKTNLPDKTILNKFETVKNQLAWKKFYENRYTNTLPELDSVKQRNAVLASLLNKAKISNNIIQKDSIERLISKHNRYKKEQYPQLELLSDYNFSVEKLQEDLTAKDIILKYIVLKNELAIYQISKNEFKIKVIPWHKNEQNTIENFIQKVRNRNTNSDLTSQLGELLIPTLNDQFTNLIINPDGILYKLPFEILQKKSKLVTEIYNVSYTSDLGFIKHKFDKTSSSENIHIYAPLYSNSTTMNDVRNTASFLNGARNEAESISKLFPSKLFNDKNLSKNQFIKTAGNAKILHLAMHADVNTDYPEFSRLLFKNNLEDETTHLYLEELYGLSLSAELAVLSACNTGSGLEKNGNLESFQRAFTFAGVPATVASLWEVPDASTEQIMVLFYENLKAGQTKSEALRNAKLSFRNKNINNKLSEPYFWAGFVVYGNDNPVLNNDSLLIVYGITAILILLIFFFILRKRKLKSQ